MKPILLIPTTIGIATALLLASCDKEQPGEPTPAEPSPNYHSFDGGIGTYDNSTLVSADDNLVICGSSMGEIGILKISKTGAQIWRNNFAAGYNSSASGIAELNGDLFICGGTSRNYSTSSWDVLLVKANSTGDTIWTKTYGGIEADGATNIIATSDGNLLIAGKTESFGAGSFGDIYLVKINTDGDTLWTASYPDPHQEVPFHLMETQNGEYLVTGTNEDNSNPRELYLLKVNSSGDLLWNRKIGPATYKWGYSTIELTDGSLMTCGDHTGSLGFSQVLLVKTDAWGNVIWEKEFGATDLSEQGNSIKQNADGSFTITGSSYDVATLTTDIILLKVDAEGNQVFLKKFGSSNSDSGINLLKDSNDDNIITGDYNGKVFMMKTDVSGTFK